MPSGRRAGSVTSNQSTGSRSTRTAKSPAKPRASKAKQAKTEAKSEADDDGDEQPAGMDEDDEAKPDIKPDDAEAHADAEAEAAAAKQEAIEAKAEADARPALPAQRNPALPPFDVPVKLQIIRRDGKNIIIGRVKLPTVNGADHGFLLKRYDTNAMAASSMYRLAFPYATSIEERTEMAYLEARYDAERANGGVGRPLPTPKRKPGRPKTKTPEELEVESLGTGSSGVRLQGTWIPCADALVVAEEYGLLRYARPLVEARAQHSETGPLLTPSKNDYVSTPSSGPRNAPPSAKRPRTTKVEETEERTSTPSGKEVVQRHRTITTGDGEIKVEETTTTVAVDKALSQAEIDAQIQEAKNVVANAKAAHPESSRQASQRKRSATDQTPSADLPDDSDSIVPNIVVRSARRTALAARRRPATAATAGALGAASAVGVGALAWLSGGNVGVASQIVQQGVQSLSSVLPNLPFW